MESIHLPQEMIEEILPKLPVKSLLRFRCVSNSWRSLIDSDNFIKTHHQNSIKNPSFPQQRAILHNMCYRPHQFSLHSLLNESSNEKPSPLVDPIDISLELLQIVGCFNGLVCILEKEQTFFLWNPSTRIIKKLPRISYRGCAWNYGFGWVESSGEYKVFALVNDSLKYLAKVYSSKTKSWKTIGQLDSSFTCGEGVFVGGRLHWYDTDGIVTFDLKSEVFGNIMMPVYTEKGIGAFDLKSEAFEQIIVLYDREKRLNKSLGVVGGCLCMIYDDQTSIRVWVLKEESWKEVDHVVELLERPFSAPFAVGPKGEIMLFYGCTFLIYYPQDNVFGFPKIFCHYESRHLYVESLVSPEHL